MTRTVSYHCNLCMSEIKAGAKSEPSLGVSFKGPQAENVCLTRLDDTFAVAHLCPRCLTGLRKGLLGIRDTVEVENQDLDEFSRKLDSWPGIKVTKADADR